MELKRQASSSLAVRLDCFNRTFMELKHGKKIIRVRLSVF